MGKIVESMKIEADLKERVKDVALYMRKSKNSIYTDLIEKGLTMVTAYPKGVEEEKIYNFELEILGTSVVSSAPVEMFKDSTATLFTKNQIELIRAEFRAMDVDDIYKKIMNQEISLQSLKQHLINKVIK